ncbi:hypothetical protein R5R35_010417 [Gryllus longicercus]|uniref:Tudor domain-containing protein n=1 Tax=Gryllus longicercus TaxID=2509291 RepID=A0AAN9VR19_9ORTH
MENQEMLFMRNGNDEDNGSDQDDVWDDSALIKAYDVAVKAVKDKIAQRLEYNNADGRDKANRKLSKKNGGLKSKKLEWQVGAACRAVYSEDGNVYEATIQHIKSNGNTCIIRYVGYENEEEVLLSQLMVSEGPEARLKQEKESAYDTNEGDAEAGNLPKSIHQSRYLLGKENIQKRSPESKKPYAKECITNFGSQFPPLHHSPYFGRASSSSMTAPPHVMPTTLPPPPPLSVTSSLPLGDSEALSAMLMSWYMSGFHTGYYQGLQQAKYMNGVAKQAP